MGWSSGTFTYTTSGLPFVTGTTISSTVANNLNSESQTGINQALNKDGSNTPTANLTLGNFRLTNVGAATAVSDAARASQVQNGSFNTLTSVSGGTTVTGSVSPTPAAYAEGQVFQAIMPAANSGQGTLNVSGLGALPIFWHGTTATTSFWSTGDALRFAYISTSSQTGFHIVGHSGFMPANLLRTRGSIVSGTGSGTIEISAPSADGQYLQSTASATAGVVWKTLLGASALTSSLGSDVALNNAANYFDGPTVTQGTVGTWLVMGQVTVQDTAGAAFISAKLWDGTTVLDSAHDFIAAVNGTVVISLAGVITSPAGNLRISVRDQTSVLGTMMFNGSGNSKDSTITAVRIG